MDLDELAYGRDLILRCVAGVEWPSRLTGRCLLSDKRLMVADNPEGGCPGPWLTLLED